MTAALLERPTTATNGCRFKNWCNGSCDDSSDRGGERNHWSPYGGMFWAYDVDERIGVQLYGYENDADGINPVRVYLAIGDDSLDEDGIALTVDGARALGVALQGIAPRHPAYEDELVYAVEADGDERAVTAEYRHERWRRCAATAQEEHVEFSVRPDSTRKHCVRVRLSLDASRALGARLMEESDRAAESNRKYGLVSR